MKSEGNKPKHLQELSKPLPCNLDAERVIMGSVLLDNAILPTIDLMPEDFSLDAHQRIWLAMLTMKEGIDLLTLAEHIKARGDLKLIGESPVSYMAGLTEGLPLRGFNRQWVAVVRRYAKLRQIIRACAAATDAAWEAVESPEEIVTMLGKALKGIRRKDGPTA